MSSHTPAYRSVIRPDVWGYSSRLDPQFTDAKRAVKTQILMSGTIKQDLSRFKKKEVNVSKFYKFGGQGMQYRFAPGTPNSLQDPPDVFGQRVVGKKKLYFCVRSNVPPGGNAIYKPRLAACIKIGYTDSE